MDVYEGACTCGDEDCARTLVIEPVYRVTVADEADRISATEFLSRAGLLDWLSSDCVIQDARNELSIDPDAYEVQQWLDTDDTARQEVADLRRQLAALLDAVPPCTCHEAYSSRGLVAPNCIRCQLEPELSAAVNVIATPHRPGKGDTR